MATGSIHVGFDRDYKITSEKKNEIKYIKRNPKSELIIEVIQVKVKPSIENNEKEPVIIGKNQQENEIEES